MLRLIQKISVSWWALALTQQEVDQDTGTLPGFMLPDVSHWVWFCIMLPVEKIESKKIKMHMNWTPRLSSQLLWSCPSFPLQSSLCSLPLNGFTEMTQSLPDSASWCLNCLLLIYAILSVKKLRAWVYHHTGPFICNCFWYHQLLCIYFLVQASVQGSDNNARQLHCPSADLRSLQLPWLSLPLEVNVPWSLWDFGLLHPHSMHLQVWAHSCTLTYSGSKNFLLKSPTFQAAKELPYFCFCHSKKNVFSCLVLALPDVILFYFIFPLIILYR